MKSYLMSQGLWDVVGGSGTTPSRKDATTAEATKEWTQKNAKAEFALKCTISSSVFEQVLRCAYAIYIQQELDQLVNKKNEAMLQLLENKLSIGEQEE